MNIFSSLVHPKLRAWLGLIDLSPYNSGGSNYRVRFTKRDLRRVSTDDIAIRLDAQTILN